MGINYPDNLIRRSRLIIPANKNRFFEKAYLRNADAIVLDLEDSIPTLEKKSTRTNIKDIIPIVSRGGSDVLVRVNNTDELLQQDIEASVCGELMGIYLPKVETIEQVENVESLLNKLEKEREIPLGQIKLGITIETTKGYLNMKEIAQSSERIDSITLGTEDFSVDSGIEISTETENGFLIPRMQVVLVARAYNKLPLGLMGSISNYNDLNDIKRNATLAYKHGFLGASCVHPKNVAILNQSFSPTEEEVVFAERVVEKIEMSLEQGSATNTLDNKMIDYAHYEKAKKVLDRHNKILKFELKKKQARESWIGGS
ncbi:HpcH/HpaI aldolase/citrate lyase family protein [Aquibacillus saliphilus]|uniref:HpcH/HpaI aldolase/citrate lyase family protein n=1 Tax=Aquibacillus saliphilus TaxID=1909422 RepID=UPI001CEFD9A7|nr:CoA ester lyase [Aquibacillus saliphilus]